MDNKTIETISYLARLKIDQSDKENIVKYLDKNISRYLNESQEAINFYYTVEEKSTGIKISFAIIYIVVVSMLLFLTIVLAITFAGSQKTYPPMRWAKSSMALTR